MAKYWPIKIYFTYTLWIKRDDLIRTTCQIYDKDDFIGQEKTPLSRDPVSASH